MAKNLVFVLILFAVGYAPLYAMAEVRLRRIIGPHFAISFVLITVLEFVLPDAIYFFPALLVIFVASVRDRMDALCRYVLLTALVPFVGWNAHVGSAFIGQFYVPDVLGLGLLIALKLKRDGKARGPRGFAAEDWVILTVFLIMWLGIGRFPSASGFLRNMVVQGLLLVFPFWLLRRSIRDTGEYRDLIAAVGAGTILLAVYAVYEARSTWAMFDYVSMHLGTTTGMSKNAGMRGGTLRATVTMLTPLNLACWMSLGLLALACTKSYFRNRTAYWGFVALAFLGLLAPQSRGNLLCLIFGMVVLCMMWRKWGYVTATFVAAGLGVTTLFAAARVSPRVAAFLNLDSQPVAGQYYDYRQLLLHRGLQEGMRHPLFGQSLDDVFARLSDIQQGEHIVDLVNTYLSFFLTAGLAGIVPLVAFLIHALRKAGTGFPARIDATTSAVRAFCVAGLCTVLVELSFMSFIDRVPFMLVLTLVGTRLVSAEKGRLVARARRSVSMGPAAPLTPSPRPA